MRCVAGVISTVFKRRRWQTVGGNVFDLTGPGSPRCAVQVMVLMPHTSILNQ